MVPRARRFSRLRIARPLASVPFVLVTAAGASAQIEGVSPMCADRPTATGDALLASPPPSASEVSRAGEVPPPASDLHCIDLYPTGQGGMASGVIELVRETGPFGVTVTPAGHHVVELTAWLSGLPAPGTLGDFTAYVAWATPLTLDPVVRLGEVANGRNRLGPVAFNKYLVMVSAEASPDATVRDGPLVLRGRSPSSRMEAHDLLATAPSATQRVEGRRPDRGPGAEPWRAPPHYEGIPMLPGLMDLEPYVDPWLPDVDVAELPSVRRNEIVDLPDGGTLDLEAGFVKRTIGNREFAMLAFNGMQPGPLIRVDAGSTIFVNFTNRTPLPTAIHWHGVRLDNRFDGVPGVTQDAVAPGETFRYQVFFRDAGIYWYHPHHREDIQQELGLYGNMLVESGDPEYYGPANRDEVIILDDLLVDDEGPVAFGEQSANYMLMGRFGNRLLVNGEPLAVGGEGYSLEVASGEVVRFHVTNAANTRTFNLLILDTTGATEPDPMASAATTRGGFDTGLPIKVVASDVGRFEREVRVRSLTIAPAERYVVDVRFPRAGQYLLMNRVQGINHRQGVFREETRLMGRVVAGDAPAEPDLAAEFGLLRVNDDVIAEFDALRPEFDRPVDHELVLTLELDSLPLPIEQSMQYDRVFFNPVEWTGTMPRMNWATTGREVKWILRDPASGAENEAIDWSFEVGDVVRIRVHNDRDAFHAMQHPLHIHGQRFVVLEQNGLPNDNLVWKDTVLLPAGSTTDILLEVSNPGRWMVHCHIAEHLESGMKLVMDVTP
ncbi:MAG: multicopper oxidase family protein [Gemmatimonadota bacterium]|nr:multicopper oxidase family protein [Gemmatimonadota bacterium]